jgi:hypothetical protein
MNTVMHVHHAMLAVSSFIITFSSCQAAIPWGLDAIELLESSMRALQPIKTK